MFKKQQSFINTVRILGVVHVYIFYAVPDPCEGAVCRIHNFCRYGNGTFDVCNCINPWNGTNCTGKIVDQIL